MAVTVEYDTYMDYAATTNVGYHLRSELPIEAQNRLDELFDNMVIDSNNHPYNIYVNRLHKVKMTELRYYIETTKYNLNLPMDEAELEIYLYDHSDEIEDAINDDYIFLGRNETTFYFLQ